MWGRASWMEASRCEWLREDVIPYLTRTAKESLAPKPYFSIPISFMRRATDFEKTGPSNGRGHWFFFAGSFGPHGCEPPISIMRGHTLHSSSSPSLKPSNNCVGILMTIGFYSMEEYCYLCHVPSIIGLRCRLPRV